MIASATRESVTGLRPCSVCYVPKPPAAFDLNASGRPRTLCWECQSKQNDKLRAAKVALVTQPTVHQFQQAYRAGVAALQAVRSGEPMVCPYDAADPRRAVWLRGRERAE